MLYQLGLDAIGLVKRYAPEPGDIVLDRLFELVPYSRMFCSVVTIGEVVWALWRKFHRSEFSRRSLQGALAAFYSEVVLNADFQKLPVTFTDVIGAMPLIGTHAINSGDALVLYAALQRAELMRLHDGRGIVVLVAADQRLLRSASREGLFPLNPEELTPDTLDMLLAWIEGA